MPDFAHALLNPQACFKSVLPSLLVEPVDMDDNEFFTVFSALLLPDEYGEMSPVFNEEQRARLRWHCNQPELSEDFSQRVFFTHQDDLWRYLKTIYSALQSELLSVDSKKACIRKLNEDIFECTHGFFNRVREILEGFALPKNVDELLALYRKDILRRSAAGVFDVHSYERFVYEANQLGLAIPTDGKEDAYLGELEPETIRTQIRQVFPNHYVPEKITKELLHPSLVELGYCGYKPDGYDPFIADKWMSFLTDINDAHDKQIFCATEEGQVDKHRYFIFDETYRILGLNEGLLQSDLLNFLEITGYFHQSYEDEQSFYSVGSEESFAFQLHLNSTHLEYSKIQVQRPFEIICYLKDIPSCILGHSFEEQPARKAFLFEKILEVVSPRFAELNHLQLLNLFEPLVTFFSESMQEQSLRLALLYGLQADLKADGNLYQVENAELSEVLLPGRHLEALPEHLNSLIDDYKILAYALKNLTPKQMNVVMAVLKEKIPNLIEYPKHFLWVLRSLPNAHRHLLYTQIKVYLPRWINHKDDLSTILNELATEDANDLLNIMEDALPHLIQNLQELVGFLRACPPASHFKVLECMRVQLPQFISSFDHLRWLLMRTPMHVYPQMLEYIDTIIQQIEWSTDKVKRLFQALTPEQSISVYETLQERIASLVCDAPDVIDPFFGVLNGRSMALAKMLHALPEEVIKQFIDKIQDNLPSLCIDDHTLSNIMTALTEEQQDYLLSRLANQLNGGVHFDCLLSIVRYLSEDPLVDFLDSMGEKLHQVVTTPEAINVLLKEPVDLTELSSEYGDLTEEAGSPVDLTETGLELVDHSASPHVSKAQLLLERLEPQLPDLFSRISKEYVIELIKQTPKEAHRIILQGATSRLQELVQSEAEANGFISTVSESNQEAALLGQSIFADLLGNRQTASPGAAAASLGFFAVDGEQTQEQRRFTDPRP